MGRSHMGSNNFKTRSAIPSDIPYIMNIIDGALLQTDLKMLKTRISRRDVIVAESHTAIIGVIILAENVIDAIAVRSKRRNQGIGSALVFAAAEQIGSPLTAEFDLTSLSFYQHLGFLISPLGENKYIGLYTIPD